MEAAVAAGRRRGIAGWAALGGVVFVVLFVIGTVLLFSGAPSGDDPPAKFVKWFSDSGHRDRIHAGWVLIGLGIFFLLWFIAGWAGWVSITVGILSLASIAFFPQFLWLLWVLVVSVVLFLRPARYGGAAAV